MYPGFSGFKPGDKEMSRDIRQKEICVSVKGLIRYFTLLENPIWAMAGVFISAAVEATLSSTACATS